MLSALRQSSRVGRRAAATALAAHRGGVLAAALGRRTIVVGRDQRNFNPIVLMVPQAEEWMIERFGKFSLVASPGLHFAIPFLETVAYKRSLKETTFGIHPQTAITKDNVHVQLDGAVYARVHDAYMASYGIDDPNQAITVLAQSAMRKEAGAATAATAAITGNAASATPQHPVLPAQVGNLELDQLFLEREKLNQGIANALDQAGPPPITSSPCISTCGSTSSPGAPC